MGRSSKLGEPNNPRKQRPFSQGGRISTRNLSFTIQMHGSPETIFDLVADMPNYGPWLSDSSLRHGSSRCSCCSWVSHHIFCVQRKCLCLGPYGGFWVPNRPTRLELGMNSTLGPHIMITGPNQERLETLNHDGSNGEPYVNHLAGHHTELFLVIPIREWSDSQAVGTTGAATR
jgi:hypothetical protein